MAHPPFAVPLPFVTALLACVVVARLLAGAGGHRTSRALFAALFAIFAIEAILVGLRFGYGLDGLIPIQRVLPLAVGPLLYIAFRTLEDPPARPGEWCLHLGAALLLVAACLASRRLALLIDLLITASYGTYLVLLVGVWRRGPDSFAGARLSNAALLRIWLVRAILLLALILTIDSLIALDFAFADGRHARLLIGIGTLILIPGFVATALLWPFDASPASSSSQRSRSQEIATADDHALAARAADLLEHTGLYRDPELSLSRVARRLGVPARRLSNAINLVQGSNVSQFVNDRRIAEAARRLARTRDSIADIMTAAGFLTRSNFYREFRRVHGVSPVDYRRLHD